MNEILVEFYEWYKGKPQYIANLVLGILFIIEAIIVGLTDTTITTITSVLMMVIIALDCFTTALNAKHKYLENDKEEE